MKNSFDLNDYEIIQDIKKSYSCYMLVIFLITVGIFIMLFKFKFSVYEIQTLIKDNEKYLIVIDSRKINELENKKYIYIDQEKYKFDIIEISKDYSNMNGSIYQTLYINPYNYKTDAIITDCYILKSKRTIYELIAEFIKGGIG